MIGRSRLFSEIHHQTPLLGVADSLLSSNFVARRILTASSKPTKLASKYSDPAESWMEMDQNLDEAVRTVKAVELDNDVRKEADHGFHQIKNIKEQLSITPDGLLGKADFAQAQFVRENIRRASLSGVLSLTKILNLLDDFSSRNDGIHRHGSGGSSAGAGTSERKSDSTLSPQVGENTPPSSPPRGRAAGFSESPSNTQLTDSPMSHDSPPNRVSSPLSLDNDAEAANVPPWRSRSGAGESFPNSVQDPSEHQAEPKRRKFPVPSKVCIKQRGTGTDLGSEGHPEDGFTWRKYGQKDILGSNYPKSYYRCTRKNDVNCQAKKQVQRSDEDPSMFDVTYLGTHSCEPTRHFPSWPFSMSPEVFARILAVSRERPSAGELSLPDFKARGESTSSGPAAEPPEELSPISALLQQPASITSRLQDVVFDRAPPLSTGGASSSSSLGPLTNPIKPESSSSDQQRVPDIMDAPTSYSMFESTSDIVSTTSMSFPAFSSGLSEGFSSQLATITMSNPAAESTTAAALTATAPGRMENPNPQEMGQNVWPAGPQSANLSKWGENLPQSIDFRQPPQQSSQDLGGLYRFSLGYPSISDSEYSHLIDPMRESGQLILSLGDSDSPTSFGEPGMQIFDTMDYDPMLTYPETSK